VADELDDVLDRLEAEPTRLDQLGRLVELHRDRGHPEDAAQRLWVAGHLLEKRRDGRALVQVVEWLLQTEPLETRNLASLALSCARLVVPARFGSVVERVAAHFIQAHDQRGLLEWALLVVRAKVEGPELATVIVEPLVSGAQGGDVKRFQLLGGIFEAAGEVEQAVFWFARVAEHYESEGTFLKAIAVFKTLLKFDPDRWRINLRLARLHARLDLRGEAEAYLLIAEKAAARLDDARGKAEIRQMRAELLPPTA